MRPSSLSLGASAELRQNAPKDSGREVRLTLPYPPSTNHLYATVNGRRVLSAEGRSFKARVGWITHAAGCVPLLGPVSVQLAAYRPRKSGDLDNVCKALLDALTGMAWKDDSQVVRLVAERFDDKERPRVEVRVIPHRAADDKEAV